MACINFDPAVIRIDKPIALLRECIFDNELLGIAWNLDSAYHCKRAVVVEPNRTRFLPKRRKRRAWAALLSNPIGCSCPILSHDPSTSI